MWSNQPSRSPLHRQEEGESTIAIWCLSLLFPLNSGHTMAKPDAPSALDPADDFGTGVIDRAAG